MPKLVYTIKNLKEAIGFLETVLFYHRQGVFLVNKSLGDGTPQRLQLAAEKIGVEIIQPETWMLDMTTSNNMLKAALAEAFKAEKLFILDCSTRDAREDELHLINEYTRIGVPCIVLRYNKEIYD